MARPTSAGAAGATSFFSTAETTTSPAETDFFGFGAGGRGWAVACSGDGAATAAGGPRLSSWICGSEAEGRAVFSAATRFHCKRQTIKARMMRAMKPAHVIRNVDK